jgi:hypothetical protein
MMSTNQPSGGYGGGHSHDTSNKLFTPTTPAKERTIVSENGTDYSSPRGKKQPWKEDNTALV